MHPVAGTEMLMNPLKVNPRSPTRSTVLSSAPKPPGKSIDPPLKLIVPADAAPMEPTNRRKDAAPSKREARLSIWHLPQTAPITHRTQQSRSTFWSSYQVSDRKR